MANIDLYKQKLVNIANSIRAKLNESSLYTLEQMPGKIDSIPVGGGVTVEDGFWYKDYPIDKSMETVTVTPVIVIGDGYQVTTVTKV